MVAPPKFVQMIENVCANLGEAAVLRCTVEGSPPLTVQWQRDGNRIPEDPHIHIVFHNQEVTFRIRACEAHHGGKYTCRAENEAGRAECSAVLVVQDSSA